MSSRYRDDSQPGGWQSWEQRLLPATLKPLKWFEFELSSAGVAKTCAWQLRTKRRSRPRGRWEFTTRKNVLKVMFLGPGR